MDYKFAFYIITDYRKCICFKRYKWYNRKVVVLLLCWFSMEGGVIMFSTLFVTIIAPIVVGVIITLFSYWLNNRDK